MINSAYKSIARTSVVHVRSVDKSRLALVSATMFLLTTTGCDRKAHVTGSVLEDGKPYRHTVEQVDITMTCDNPGINISTSVQENGTFNFYGPNGDGLPPGKYKIGYFSDIDDKYASLGNTEKKRIKDLSADKSSLEIEVAAGEKVDLVLDLVKQTMEKK